MSDRICHSGEETIPFSADLSAKPPNLLAPEGRDAPKGAVRGESIPANALTE